MDFLPPLSLPPIPDPLDLLATVLRAPLVPWWPQLSVQVAIWLLGAAVGLLYTVYNWIDARLDLRAELAHDDVRPGHQRIARGSVRRDGMRVLIFVAYVLIAVDLLSPAFPGRGTLFALLLLISEWLLTANSYLDRQERRWLLGRRDGARRGRQHQQRTPTTPTWPDKEGLGG